MLGTFSSLQTLSTTGSRRNWPCFPGINSQQWVKRVWLWECLSFFSPSPAITNICLAAEMCPQQQRVHMGHQHRRACTSSLATTI